MRAKRIFGIAAFAATAVSLAASDALAAPGDLDPTFGVGGVVTTDFPGVGGERAQAVVRQPDGKLVVAGSVALSSFALARYDASGALDSGFDGDGRVVTSFITLFGPSPATADALAVAPDGKIVAAGGLTGTPSGFVLARYNADGSLDSSFDGDGRLVHGYPSLPFGISYSPARAVAVQPDGKIVAVGTNQSSGQCQFVLARFDTGGAPDATFDGDGVATTGIFDPFGGCEAKALVLQPDGKLVVAGRISASFGGSQFGLARFLPNGALDPTFGTGGVATTVTFHTLLASSVALQPDGKLVVAGSVGARDGIALARFNGDGTRDSSFDGDGLVVTGPPAFSGGATALVVEPDGKLAVAGSEAIVDPITLAVRERFAVARYEADGRLDAAFGGDGIVSTEISGSAGAAARGLVLQLDGRLVVAGISFPPGDGGFGAFALVRYQGDLAADATPPVVTVPSDLTVDATSPTGAVVTYTASAVDDIDGPVAVACAPPSGATFAVGSTLVSCDAVDAAGNRASATFQVTVRGAAEQLDALIERVLAARVGGGLGGKLKDAQLALAAGNTGHACEALAKFVDKARKQVGRTLTEAEAAELVAAASRIRAVLACD